jgi:beta-lactamase superfamily II metal-dependent hydrolase
MKLRIFQSDHGDCLLLQASGHNILCDGGMSTSMRRHVREPLVDLVNDNGGKLDAVYVSHIDQDHISGVLQLLKDAIDWKVHDHHAANGDTSVRAPRFPRPPKIDALWHNSFQDQVGDNSGEIGDLLAAAVPLLQSTAVDQFVHEAHELGNIAASISEALKVSRFAKPDFLDIPVNVLPGDTGPGGLLFYKDETKTFRIGSMTFTLVGPSQKALEDLKEGWNNWLVTKRGKDGLKSVKRAIRKQLERFANGQLDTSPFALFDWNGINAFKGVTAPNVASLVFMVEDDGKRILLTGDAQQDKLLEDLQAAGFLEDGHCHLDVLKVQHHGSEHNMDKNFARRVSADHYVFCGNGSNGNPEREVLDIIFKSRIGPASRRALAPQAADRPFTFWFSTNSADLPADSGKRDNFEATEEQVERLIARSNGLMSARFAEHDFHTLEV